jgi:5'-3' exonuclease
MGLKGFKKYVETESQKNKQTIYIVHPQYVDFSAYLCKNKINPAPVIAIDTNTYFYKYRISTGKPLVGFFNQIVKFLKNGTIPLYVIDGRAPVQKQHITTQRREKRKKKVEKITDEEKVLSNFDVDLDSTTPNFLFNPIKETILVANEHVKYDLSHFIEMTKCWLVKTSETVIEKRVQKEAPLVGKELSNDLIGLLNLLGVRHIKMNMEADVVCGALYNQGIIDACLSGDMDLLPYGCKHLIQIEEGGKVIHFELEKIKKLLGLDDDKFITFCTLTGCDYVEYRINKKHTELLKLVKEKKNIEECLTELETNDIGLSKYREDFINAREIYVSSRTLELNKLDLSIIEPISFNSIDKFMTDKLTREEWYRYRRRFEVQIQFINKNIKQGLFKRN